ncbi:neuronal acetylcholine receptor subunit alpha-10-like [Mytilus galloprovincialis]|uniref:Uncharacterized protein n=1 Tax=Mytilus galloprovincialis TaxID=29158 RepID=A0A8B6CQL7_MYTGA|nr:Hypothetical predicted protein [Mytilus galloprovincialis]
MRCDEAFSIVFLLLLLQSLVHSVIQGQNLTDEQRLFMTDEQRLLSVLMKHYSSETRPVFNASHPVVVRLGITLTQLFDVDERNQVLVLNIWLDQEWKDEKLLWDPADYNGLELLRIPCTKLWRPDIILYNSANDYTNKYMESLAMVGHDGNVFWPPIVKFRSTCQMDITYFPFDDQICKLKMGSWLYDGFQVDVTNRSVDIDLSNYVENGEWKLIDTKAIRNVVVYPCCPTPFPDVTFHIHIRRRTTYYMYNVIIPSAMLASLTLLGFWLRPDSGEKITLGLTVLLSLSVFMLLIAENTPATSFYVPLLGIYLITAMSFTSCSIIFSVLVSNIYMKGMHDPVPLPYCFKRVVKFLSKAMCMTLYHIPYQPKPSQTHLVETVYTGNGSFRKLPMVNGTTRVCDSILFVKGENEVNNSNQPNPYNTSQENTEKFQELVLQTLQNLIDREEEKDRETNLRNQWQEAGTVLDRFMFWLFFTGTLTGTLYLLIFLPMRKEVHL